MLEQAYRIIVLHANLIYNSGATSSALTGGSIKLLLVCMSGFTRLFHVALCWSYVQMCRCSASLGRRWIDILLLSSCSCLQCAWNIPASKSCNERKYSLQRKYSLLLYQAMHRREQRACNLCTPDPDALLLPLGKFRGCKIGPMPDREGAFAGLSQHIHIGLQRLLWQYVSFKLGGFPQYTLSFCRAS